MQMFRITRSTVMLIFVIALFALAKTQDTETPSCAMPGRFQIDDPQCQSYYICIWDGVNYTSWNLTCPKSTRFSPSIQMCVAEEAYPCPIATTSTTPSTVTATTSSTIPASTSTLLSITSETPSTTSATPSTGTATTPSATPASTSTTVTTSTTSATSTMSTALSSSTTLPSSTASQVFQCTASGRFPRPNTDCRLYYFCFWNGSSYTQWNLQCPSLTRFDANKRRCVMTFTCTS